MAQIQRAPKQRIYVKVASIFDKTGYMLPTSIIWDNGKGNDRFRPVFRAGN